MFDKITPLFIPNARNSRSVMGIMVAIQIVLALVIWSFSKSPIFPTPLEILRALGRLFSEQDLAYDLWVSTWLCLKSMCIALIISLLITYASVVPFFRPLGFLVSKGRFLTLVGLSFIFTQLFGGGSTLKSTLMVFGITVFFVTSMLSIIQSIQKYEFYHARTLRMNDWEVLWEVIILGKIDQMFEVVRQNFAIAWTMLTLVEGLVRSEGGIGVILLNNQKFQRFDAIFAIQLVVLLTGIFLDWVFSQMRTFFFPYSMLTVEK